MARFTDLAARLAGAVPLGQCVHMWEEDQAGFDWPLSSGSAAVTLRWHKLGSVTWADGIAKFPRGPDNPGVYLVKVAARGKYRLYIGEARNLRRRLRSFGGRGATYPIQPGKTTTNMKSRVRSALRQGDGSAEVHLLQLPLDAALATCEAFPDCKDCRVMLESPVHGSPAPRAPDQRARLPEGAGRRPPPIGGPNTRRRRASQIVTQATTA
jgi:hypothetical protein